MRTENWRADFEALRQRALQPAVRAPRTPAPRHHLDRQRAMLNKAALHQAMRGLHDDDQGDLLEGFVGQGHRRDRVGDWRPNLPLPLAKFELPELAPPPYAIEHGLALLNA